jgi:hypothetical protein
LLRHPSFLTIPISRVFCGDRGFEPEALEAMRLADRRYLETRPGQWFTAVWEVGPAPSGRARTYLLASQGYYTEWIRGGWLAGARDTTPFSPTDASLVQAMRRWRGAQDSLEARFYASRILVR